MPEVPAAGGVIASVGTGDAARAGLRPGDVVTAVDGQPVRDVIDWWWLTEEPSFRVTVVRDRETIDLTIARTPGTALGVVFTEVLFTPIRQCENACAFCFIAGLPRGLRPALYVRDDDYRLSFLSGNFVTLTNVDEAEVARIIGQRLSPLHVSVHAVDPDVRSRLMCPTAGDRGIEILEELLAAGIEAHVQIVLVPGVNDGPVLEETLAYLGQRDGVLSVGCVPMGFTAHQGRWTASYDAASAADVVGLTARWQQRMRAERGIGWVYPADEFYLLAGIAVPVAAEYDEFPQFENGIGMVSAFLDEFDAADRTPVAATVVTGELFAPVLGGVLERAGWSDTVRVLGVRNELFGGNVSVTGLLGGADIASAIGEDAWRGTYLVPDVVVNSDGLLIDDVPAAKLSALASADVRFIGSDAGSLLEALTTRTGRL
jgi:putative radical SAM enzyme (TIGR03279 family)